MFKKAQVQYASAGVIVSLPMASFRPLVITGFLSESADRSPVRASGTRSFSGKIVISLPEWV
jgi:hypothetical protein